MDIDSTDNPQSGVVPSCKGHVGSRALVLVKLHVVIGWRSVLRVLLAWNLQQRANIDTVVIGLRNKLRDIRIRFAWNLVMLRHQNPLRTYLDPRALAVPSRHGDTHDGCLPCNLELKL
jgi:hypothetical protein